MRQIGGLVLFILLAACGPSESEIPRLMNELRDQDDAVRNQAALDLASLGPKAEKAVPALIQRLKDENGGVRSSAAYALRVIGTPQAKQALDKAREK